MADFLLHVRVTVTFTAFRSTWMLSNTLTHFCTLTCCYSMHRLADFLPHDPVAVTFTAFRSTWTL